MHACMNQSINYQNNGQTTDQRINQSINQSTDAIQSSIIDGWVVKGQAGVAPRELFGRRSVVWNRQYGTPVGFEITHDVSYELVGSFT